MSKNGALAALGFLLLPSAALCQQPVTLACKGTLTAEGKESPFSESGAVLNLERQTFRAPVYGLEYPLIRVDDTSISFGSESADHSTAGSLDRISGKLSMTVMHPAERKKMMGGQAAKVSVILSALCAPAQRLF